MEKKSIVDYSGENAPEERTDPIDSVIRPVASYESGSERTGGIHRGAGKGIAHQHSGGDGKADGEAGESVGDTSGVDHGGKEDKDKNKGENGFEDHSVHAGEIRDGDEVGGA